MFLPALLPPVDDLLVFAFRGVTLTSSISVKENLAYLIPNVPSP